MQNENGSAHDPHRLSREADGSARLRIRFSASEADAMEAAAGGIPIMDWIHLTLRSATRQTTFEV